MATAPRPGAAREHEAALHVLRLRVRDRTVDVPLPANLPIKEKFAVRSATGLPIDVHFNGENAFGEDSLIVLWWLGRRADGEPSLAFADAAAEWPSDLTEQDIDFELVNLDGDPKEADHPEG